MAKIVKAAAIVGVAVTFWWAVGIFVIYTLLTAKKKSVAQQGISVKDRTATIISNESPHVYVYGRARVGSAIVAVLTGGDKDQFKYIVCVHAGHECDAIEEYYINGNSLGVIDVDGLPQLKGTAVNSTTNSAGYAIGITTITLNTVGTGTILAADKITFAGDENIYVIATGNANVAAGGNIILSAPGLKKALAASATELTVLERDYIYAETVAYSESNSGTSWTLDYTPIAGSLILSYSVYGEVATEPPTITTNIITLGASDYTLSGTTVTIGWVAESIECSYEYLNTFSSVRIFNKLGVAGQAAQATVMSDLPTKWDSTKTLSGLCYSIVKIDLNKEEFQSGVPKIEVLLRGKKVKDVRAGAYPSDTPAWSQNTTNILADYMSSEMCKVPTGDFPLADYIAAANVCDESTAYGLKYLTNGVVTSDDSPLDVINELVASMAGTFSSTTFGITAGKYVAPVMSLSQSDIVGDMSFTAGGSEADLFNGVKGKFISSGNNYISTDFAPYKNSTYALADGGGVTELELWQDIDFNWTDTKQRVHNLARIFIEDIRNNFTLDADFSYKTWKLQIGQRVTFTSSFLGQTSKIYRVMGKSFGQKSAVTLTLKEDTATIWDLADAVTVDSTPNTSLPNPFVVSAPTSLAFAQDLVKPTTALLTWQSANDITVATYEIDYRNAGDWVSVGTTNTRNKAIDNLTPGVYAFRVRGHNTFVTSQYAYIYGSVMTGLLTPNVSGLEVFGLGNSSEFTGRDCKFSWRVRSTTQSHDLNGSESYGSGTGGNDPYFKDYEVSIYKTDGTLLRTENTTDNFYTYTFEKNAEDNAGVAVRSFSVKVWQRGITNQLSTTPAQITVSNPAPGLPTAVSMTTTFDNIFLSFVPPIDTDYAGLLVYTSTSTGFTPSSLNLSYKGIDTLVSIAAATGTAYYLRYASFDVFGEDGVTLSGELTATTARIGSADLTAALTADLADKLSKTAANIMTSSGTIGLNTTQSIWIGASLAGSLNDGLYMGSGGIFGRKASATTFSIDNLGNAIFGGSLNAASGSFAGSLTAVTGTLHTLTLTSTGSIDVSTGGKVFGGKSTYASATAGFFLGYESASYRFSFGGGAGNALTWDGTTLTVPGSVVTTGINADNVTAGAIRGRNINGSSHTTLGSYLTAAASAAATTLTVHNTTDFPSSGSGVIIGSTNDRDAFTYTGKTSTTLTGCSGVLAHDINQTIIPLLKNMVIDASSNELRFYGDAGAGVEEIGSIGTSGAGVSDVIAKFGTVGSNKTALVLDAAGNTCLAATSSAAGAIEGFTGASASSIHSAIRGVNYGGGYGISGDSTTGNGGRFFGNATKGNLYLPQRTANPTSVTVDQLAFINTVGTGSVMRLCYSDGTNWRRVDTNAII